MLPRDRALSLDAANHHHQLTHLDTNLSYYHSTPLTHPNSTVIMSFSRSALKLTTPRSAASFVSRRAYAAPNITTGGSVGPNGPEKTRQPDINTVEEKTNPLYVSVA